MKVEVAVRLLGFPSLKVHCTVSVDVKQQFEEERQSVRFQELCESRGGRPGLPVPNRVSAVDVKLR